MLHIYLFFQFFHFFSHFAVLLKKSLYLMVPLLQTLTIIIEHQTFYIIKFFVVPSSDDLFPPNAGFS